MICTRCGAEADAHTTTCRVCLAPLGVISAEATVVAVAAVDAPFETRLDAAFETSADAFATRLGPAAPTTAGEADATIAGLPSPVRLEGGLLPEGTDFGPRYHIIRTLGAGAMGSVYHAWDKELCVAVALKIIKLSQDADAVEARSLEERFKRELLLARKVTHTGVVRIFDLGVIDGIKYITMSYVDGQDLLAMLKHAGGRLPIAQVLAIAREVVEGLRAAHDAGVVHRDLKPANIMVEAATGKALIMDFGIALSPADGRPRSEGIVGTLAYMSPQQATGKPVDQRTDLYSFGLILYDLLGGRSIERDSERAMADMLARIGSAPDPIRVQNPDVPEAVDALIAKCLEPSVERRYQTAAEVAADLARLDENGVPIPLPKNRPLAFLGAAAILTLVLTTVGWWVGRASRAPAVEHEPASVLVADFDNRTGDPVFSGSLEQALSDSLERASFITAYRRDAAKRIAQQVRRGGPFDADAARLVSRREGVNYVLAGSIQPKGPGYSIDVTALEPATGKVLSTVSANARSKADVLAAVGSAGEKIRASLGETSQERQQHGADATETFTAASLEAMNAYARAQDLANATRNKEALAAYQEAVTLDPGFGRAYAGMGVLYTVFKDEARAKAAYDQALRYVGRMSDREKYRTLGTYYLSVARNYEKAIENYEMLVKLYPGDAVGHGNLGLAYLNAGNLKRAAEEGRIVIRLDPKNAVQRYNYAMYSLYAGDLGVAATEGETIVKDSPSFELAYLPIGLAKTLGGDLAGAEATYDSLAATGASGASLAQFARIDLAMFRGRYADASTMAAATLTADRNANNPGAIARDLVVAAEAFTVLGRKTNAIAAATQAVSLSDHESVLFPAALVLIETGREEDAQKIADRLENMLQQQTTAYARVISADIAVRRGRYGPAIELFRDSIKRRDTWMARFLLGRTYAEADHFAEAMAELELCVKRRGEAADPFFYDTPSLRYLPPVYYWLARAQLAMGVADAAKNYEYYLTLRRGAAPPDPLVADAERRLATLK
jgi:tetratricopeptide (TPR) repeat protein/tRNA A-37 threonylcarbamoyl transferase component Bud32